MDQQQIRVKFPIGTKLIVSTVTLLFIFILSLNISTIILFKDDKLAYIYKTQAIASQLFGKQFMNSSSHAMDTLKTILASVDPNHPLERSRKTTINTLLANQTDILCSQVLLVNPESASLSLYSQATKESELEAIHLKIDQPLISSESMKNLMPELLRTGFSFVNLTQVGGPPLMGLLLADRLYKSHPKGMPVALGLISLQSLAETIQGTQITVSNRQGWVLFDSNPTKGLPKHHITDSPLFQKAIQSRINNGTQEFDFEDQHLLGTFVSPGLNLIVITTTPWENAMRATYMLIEKFALIGFMAIGTAILFSIFFAKTLTAPLVKLFEATKEVGNGNFKLKLEEKGRDEIGVLSKAFNAMSRKISILIQESVDKVILENELSIASLVQQNLIPQADFKNDWIEVQSYYRPSAQCGGDWWGFFTVGDKMVFMVADATGHGFPSALITAAASSCFSVIQKITQSLNDIPFSPKTLLALANRSVYDSGKGQIMMTFFIGIIHQKTRTLHYASAGHNPPWLFKKENNQYTLKSLTARGQRLGEGPDLNDFEEKSISISPHDILFLYTDGLTEGKNAAGEMFGKKKVRQVLEAHLELSPRPLIEKLMSEFQKHNGIKSLDDDITIAIAQILK